MRYTKPLLDNGIGEITPDDVSFSLISMEAAWISLVDAFHLMDDLVVAVPIIRNCRNWDEVWHMLPTIACHFHRQHQW